MKGLLSIALRIFSLTLIFGVAFGAFLSQKTAAQCVDNPSGRTAVRLDNQTKYDLVFGIDDDDKGIVPSRRQSPEWDVEPGIHLLIVGTVREGKAVWVWTNNEVPKGQLCTWIVEDPRPERLQKQIPGFSVGAGCIGLNCGIKAAWMSEFEGG